MSAELPGPTARATVGCAPELHLAALTALPRVEPGDDLGALLGAAVKDQGIAMADHDVVVVASKLVAKAEGRYVDLATVEPSPRACELGRDVGKDPRLVELILRDSERVSRMTRGALIVRHGGGHVSANAGIDQSNARPRVAAEGSGPWVLRLPADGDASAERLRSSLRARFGVELAVIISDSFGRPFRHGTVGMAIGAAGLPALFDQRGMRDLEGRLLEATITAPADQLAAVCDLVMGQADEARGAVHVRGLHWSGATGAARELCRDAEGDLYL